MADPDQSIYDSEVEEEDLWFIPAPPEDADPATPPWLTGQSHDLTARDWARAEAANARALAEATALFATLDERLRWFDPRVARRLAIEEVSDLTWIAGLRLTADRIALHDVLRVEMSGDDAAALEYAIWAVRRLLQQADPIEDPAGFLGRALHDETSELAEDLPVAASPALDDWRRAMFDIGHLHPLTRAAASVSYGRLAGLADGERLIELAVLAQSVGASGARGMATFLPVAGGDARAFTRSGKPGEILPLWLTAVENACLRALMRLDRLKDWHDTATQKTADLSGRTPPLLIDLLQAVPAVSAEMVSQILDITTMTARRNLDIFISRGLVRELTGQERYRFWTTRL